MSKHYRIRFSPIDAEIDGVDEQGKPTKIKVRKLEKNMLCTLYDIAGSTAKSIKENRIAADNFANVDAINLETEDASILLTEEDHKQLVEAHKAAGAMGKIGRPGGWNRLRALLTQLENPTEETPT